METAKIVASIKTVYLPSIGEKGELLYKEPFVTLFWQSVRKTEECWLWLGSVNIQGYGLFAGVLVHRYSFRVTHGDPPSDRHHLHHTCRNKLCVRPLHLQPLTAHQHGKVHRHRFNTWNRGGANFDPDRTPDYSIQMVKHVLPVVTVKKDRRNRKALQTRIQKVRKPVKLSEHRKTTVHVNLDNRIVRRLNVMAREEWRSFAGMVRRLIDEALLVRLTTPTIKNTPIEPKLLK